MRIPRRALLFALGGVLLALACNLTTTPPTPTASPATPTPAITSLAPTLFASITPLAGFGGFGGAQPTAAPTNACPVPAGWVPYTIQDGDYLAGLADATGTTVQAIVQANCLPDADTIFSGEVIYLPRSPVSG